MMIIEEQNRSEMAERGFSAGVRSHLGTRLWYASRFTRVTRLISFRLLSFILLFPLSLCCKNNGNFLHMDDLSDLSDLSDSDFPTLEQLIDADVYRRQVDYLPSPSLPRITTPRTKPKGKGGFNRNSNNVDLPRSPLSDSSRNPGVNISELSSRKPILIPSSQQKPRKDRVPRCFKKDTFSDTEEYREAGSPSTKPNLGPQTQLVASSPVTPIKQPIPSSRKRTIRRRSGRCNADDLSPPPSVLSKHKSVMSYDTFVSDLPPSSPTLERRPQGPSRRDPSFLSKEVISLLSEDEDEDANNSDRERDAVERFVMGEADMDVPKSSVLPCPNRTEYIGKTVTKPRTRPLGKPKGTHPLDTPSLSPIVSVSPKALDNLPLASSSSSLPESVASPATFVDDWGLQGMEDGYLISNEDEGVLKWSPPPKRLTLIQDGHPVYVLPDPPRSPSLSATPSKSRPKAKPRSKSTETAFESSTAGSAQTVMKVNSKQWKARRETLAIDLINELDRNIFKQAIRPSLGREAEANEQKDTSELGGVVWTGKLRTTAGMSRWCRREGPSGKDDVRHVCTVELSTKILDTEEKVLSTTAHELCHLATWIFDGKNTKPHGKEFKAWAQKVMDYRTDISITTKHTFEIVHKYKWICEGCSASYGRDTKSIDPSKQCCGKCKGRLIPQFKSQNQNQGQSDLSATASGSGSMTPGKPNAYREFVKRNYKTTASPGMSAPQVMKLVAEKWRAQQSAIPPSPSSPLSPLLSTSPGVDVYDGAKIGEKIGPERGEEDLSSVLRELSIQEDKGL